MRTTLAVADDNTGAAEFVRLDYLRDNGVNDVTITEAWERQS